ncbi:MAG: hypothetical protein JWL77_6149 [Chthonomonadaceae bacterium]|nr:hypothetical protein [Chthonomonadaceae bacterium]
MQAPDLPPVPPLPPKVCALCGEALTPAGEFCPKCGAESMSLRVRPPRPGLQFTPINHFWVVLLIAGFVFGILYNVLKKTGMVQTYAMFVGIPMVIGVLVAYLSRPESGLGTTIKVVTLLLCAFCPLVGEYSICVLMAAPLFYAFAVCGYFLVKWTGPDRRRGPMAILIVPFVMAMMTSDRNHIDNPATNIVTDEIFVAAPPERVMQTIEQSDRVPHDFSAFLKLGFPLPKRLEREPNGLTRMVFDPGAEPWHGTNTIVSQQTTDLLHHTITYTILEDGTKLARWMTFRNIEFEILPRPGGSLVRQHTVYEQRMQPGFYWNTVEDFAMGQMHGYALRNIKRQTEAGKP